MQNIFVIGAQCTGKTTLVGALEQYVLQNRECGQPAIIREVARNVLKEGGFTRDDIENSPARAMQLQEKILSAQFQIESSIIGNTGRKWYISDRSGLDPIAYAHVYVSPDSAQALLGTREWTALETNMKSGLVILCEAGGRWLTDDGTRLIPKNDEDWDRVDSAFRLLLQARGIDFKVLSRDTECIEDRVSFVTQFWH